MKQNRLDAKTLQQVLPTSSITGNSPKTLGKKRTELLALFGLSAGLDVALFAAELPLDATLFGLPLVVDEVLEFGISHLIGRNRIKLKWYDKAIGLLPIPGITAITVRAGFELIRSFTQPAKFMEEEPAAIEE